MTATYRRYGGPNFSSGVFAVMLLLATATAGFAQVTAIRAGQVIDPSTGTVARNQVIVVEHGTITDVGAQVTIPSAPQ